ncbi:myogenesis-regulating glycosidase-like [Haliotis asinina]|uniref:myogenesis-regulating glycosidase-like n=1 Tax=Haliotis asinina TaxID=109174 RepID=UPI0035318EDE
MKHIMFPRRPGLACILLLAAAIIHRTVESSGSVNLDVSVQPAYKFGHIAVDVAAQPMELTLENAHGRSALVTQLGTHFLSVSPTIQRRGNTFSIEVPKSADLRIRQYQYQNSDCVDVTWSATSCITEVLNDCFQLGQSHWYGGSELREQLWPLEKVDMDMKPYLAMDHINEDKYGPVQERMFFNSDGHGVYVEEDIPLFVSINATGDNRLCLQAKYDEYWYSSGGVNLPELNYTVCTAPDVRSIHKLLSDRYIKKPEGTPNPLLFRAPIWSTWAKYKTKINQSLVAEFVDDIKKHNFPVSQIEIDDVWTPKYGDMDFDPVTFPDPQSLVNAMHSENISVTLWVHPFININANAFPYLASRGWMIQDLLEETPALTSWWNGQNAGHIDFSNSDATQWFLKEVSHLKTSYGIDSFKFDAGDVNYLPPIFKAKMDFVNRNHLTRLYATAAHQSDTTEKRQEVRTGIRTQHLPVMVRMLDKYSTWTFTQGFRSTITSGLVFGLLGYPFVLADYIGGNSYNAYPDPELFIRWVQANALMPLMQFSLEPWAYSNITVLEVAQDMVKLHGKYADKIIGLANDSVITGYPIMRPVWWIAPTDEAALTVDDQFLLGDDVLVAPVVEQGATMRRIYLPAGRWRDELKGQTQDGGKWIDYPVTLRDLPYFTKLS